MSFSLESMVEDNLESINWNLKLLEHQWEELHSRIQKAKAETGESEEWTTEIDDAIIARVSTIQNSVSRVRTAFTDVRSEIEFIPEPE